jgi:copper chaperone CopZ
MLILKTALVVILAVRGETVKPRSPAAPPPIAALGGTELARAIKTDLESISGAGTVNVSVDNGTLFRARIAIPGFNPGICAKIYDREMALRQLFPGLNFDFYFGGTELARVIKTDLESISGRGTVDVSVDSKTLFSVRIAMAGLNAEIYNRIFDRELEFYRAFRDLNFDFYLRLNPVEPAPTSYR